MYEYCQVCEILQFERLGGAGRYLDHSTERLRRLKVIVRSLKQNGSNVASQPETAAGIRLQSLIYAIDTVARIMNFKIFASE
jgi:hypothetical protein